VLNQFIFNLKQQQQTMFGFFNKKAPAQSTVTVQQPKGFAGLKSRFLKKNSTLAAPGVPVKHSSLFYGSAPGVVKKPTLFQKAKLLCKIDI
jgi:hypothetical protein